MSVQPIKPTTVTPLVGTPARQVARLQGHVWLATAAHTEIGERVEIIDTIDARGDALMSAHRRLLARAARMALLEGAVQTHAMLVEAVASATLLAEWDDAEDTHRGEIGDAADDGERAGRAANAVCVLLLGQREAEMPETVPLVLVGEVQP